MRSDTFGEPALLARIETEAVAFSGEFGCFARDLATGEEIGYRADAVMPTASTIKVGILAELYARVDSGEIDLDQRLTIEPDDWALGSGVLKDLAPGLAPTVRDLARLMIVLSDNVATGMLVRRLGKDRINRTLRGWGLVRTELVWALARTFDIRDYAVSTPRELARLMELIATDAIVTPAACAAMRDHLGRQHYLDQIARFLPFNPYAADLDIEQPIAVMSKSGFFMGVRVDAAIVRAPATTFVLATMTEGSHDLSVGQEQEGIVLNGSVARLVFDAWVGDLGLDEEAAAFLGPATFTPLSRRAER